MQQACNKQQHTFLASTDTKYEWCHFLTTNSLLKKNKIYVMFPCNEQTDHLNRIHNFCAKFENLEN